METKDYNTEWCLLQNQFDSYEKHSLYIKLLSVIVVLVAEVSDSISLLIVLVLLVLWLQCESSRIVRVRSSFVARNRQGQEKRGQIYF